MDLTFLIPSKLETEDRVRNLTTILCFLLTNFDAEIQIKEVDVEQKVDKLVLPFIEKQFGQIPKNLKYNYEKQTKDYFHKTKILNDLIELSTTKIVCNYDTDVILPIKSIQLSYDLIDSKTSDAVYPYGVGAYQKAVRYTQEMFNAFVSSDMKQQDIKILEKDYFLSSSTIGWCQFIRKENYIKSFMMNENFAAWGPEDCELHYRLKVMGNKVDRINDYVYHLEHSRSVDSWFSNPSWRQNAELWEWVRRQTKENLINYYKNQDYIKRRNLNVSI